MLRTALAVVLPFAVLLPVVAPDLATILWKYGGASSTYDLYILSLSLFGIGVVFFTVHYLVLRGFYALERNRTVFLIQCAVGATNIVAAVVLVARTDAEHTAPALVVAYAASYVVGSVVSYLVLRRVLGAGCRAGRPSWSGSWSGWRSSPRSRRPSRWPWPCCCRGATSPATSAPSSGWSWSPAADVAVFLVLARAAPAHRGDRRARHGHEKGHPESAPDLTRSRTYDETSPDWRKGHGVARDPPR